MSIIDIKIKTIFIPDIIIGIFAFNNGTKDHSFKKN